MYPLRMDFDRHVKKKKSFPARFLLYLLWLVMLCVINGRFAHAPPRPILQAAQTTFFVTHLILGSVWIAASTDNKDQVRALCP